MNIFTTIWEKIKTFGRWVKRKVKQLLIWLGIIGIATASTVVVQDLTRNEVSLDKLQQKYEQSVEIKEKYQMVGGALLREAKSNPRDRIVVEIGNKNSQEFVPEIIISRWDEVSFRIIPDLTGVATKDRDLIFEGDKIKFKTPKMDYEMYEYSEGEGGYKFIWYLNEKPEDRTICFGIESSGLDFYYQPELTQEEINRGAFRPENVVGSYAVYMTNPGTNWVGGKLYRVGKFGHIYRPRLYDSSGWETWAERLLIKDNQYCVIMPEDFWDKAVYPIKSNDILGYNSLGSYAWGDIANYTNDNSSTIGETFNLSENGNITQMSAGLRTGAGPETVDLFLAVYREDSVATDSHDLVASAESLNKSFNTTLAFHNINFASELLVADDYILAALGNGEDLTGDRVRLYSDLTGSSRNYYGEVTTGSGSYATRKAEDPWGEVKGSFAVQMSIYATYTPAGEEEEEERRFFIFD